MVIDLKQCAALLREHNEFVIIAHEHPDGDTLGAAFALAEILKKMGKKRVVKCSDIIPKDFYYITDSYVADDVTDPFIVTVDVADGTMEVYNITVIYFFDEYVIAACEPVVA